MIVQSIIDWFVNVIVTLIEIVNPSLETEVGGLAGALDGFFDAIGAQLGLIDPFIPVGAIGIAVAQVAATVGFLMLVWLGQFIVSVATGGGGSV